MCKNLKLFVGGYYDGRIFVGEYFEGKTPFGKDIDTYTLEEVIRLPFVENVADWYEDRAEKSFYKATEEEKINAILEYTESDEMAGIVYFKTEKEAEEFKKRTIKEIEEIEQVIIYEGKEQDSDGFYREVYSYNMF